MTLVRRGPLALDQLTVRMQPLGEGHGSATIVVTATVGNGATAVDRSLLETQSTVLELRITEHVTGRLVRTVRVPTAAALTDQHQATAEPPGGTAPADLRLELNISEPRLWSPASPALYHADLRLLSAPITPNSPQARVWAHTHARFGLREVTINGQYFMLNGARHFMVSHAV